MSTAAYGTSATLVRDQASVSIIARVTTASITAEQASTSIVADAAGARTVLLRPTPHHDVMHEQMQMAWYEGKVEARCRGSMEQVVDKLGCWIGLGMWWRSRSGEARRGG